VAVWAVSNFVNGNQNFPGMFSICPNSGSLALLMKETADASEMSFFVYNNLSYHKPEGQSEYSLQL
jgi:hypothetical protein